MSSFIIKWITNRFLKDNQLTKFGVEDPYYEYIVTGHDRQGKPKYKKTERQVPKGISGNDTKVLLDVKKQAYRYDFWFTFLGLRFGLSNIVGFVPLAGALVSNYWSLSLFWRARSLDDGLPFDVQLVFLFNIVVDFLLSLIPIVGDIIAIGYKANLRNFLLLEKHLVCLGQKNMGIISEDEVRPAFLNEKIRPYMEENVVPGAVKAGEQIKRFVKKSFKNSASSDGSVTSNATILSSEVTAVGTLDTPLDDDTKSIRSFADMR